MGMIPGLEEAQDMLRRRYALIAGVMMLGFAASVMIGLSRDPVYEAREVIQIAPPRVAEDMARTTVRGRLWQQLAVLRQGLLSNAALTEIAVAYELFADLPGLTAEARAGLLRDAVHIDWQTETGDWEPTQIVLSARMKSPEAARQVAQELGHRMIRDNVRMRIGEAQATLDFLIAREAAMMTDVVTQERRLAAFRAEHAADLAVREPGLAAELARNDAETLATDRDRVELDARILALGETAPVRLLDDMAEQARALDQRRVLLADNRRALLMSMAPSAALEPVYAALLRGMTAQLAQLDEIADRRIQAEVGLLLETRRQSERLIVAEPAERPATPLSDGRGLVAMAGGLISTVLALVIAALLDLRNPVLRTPRRMRRLTGIEPIVSIPRARILRRGFSPRRDVA